jgi:hypothetical protein
MPRRIHASIVPVSWALLFGFAIAACDSRPSHRPGPSPCPHAARAGDGRRRMATKPLEYTAADSAGVVFLGVSDALSGAAFQFTIQD